MGKVQEFKIMEVLMISHLQPSSGERFNLRRTENYLKTIAMFDTTMIICHIKWVIKSDKHENTESLKRIMLYMFTYKYNKSTQMIILIKCNGEYESNPQVIGFMTTTSKN